MHCINTINNNNNNNNKMSSKLTRQQLRGLNDILYTNWRQLLPAETANLIDSDKLGALSGRGALCRMLDTSQIPDNDKLHIRNVRDRLNRTKATKKFRSKQKDEMRQLREEIPALIHEKSEMLEEKLELKNEIEFYKNACLNLHTSVYSIL